jgi:hypothetical protein
MKHMVIADRFDVGHLVFGRKINESSNKVYNKMFAHMYYLWHFLQIEATTLDN